MKKQTNNIPTIDVNATHEQITSFKKTDSNYTFWTNDASSMMIVQIENEFVVYGDNDAQHYMVKFNDLDYAKLHVIETYYKITYLMEINK